MPPVNSGTTILENAPFGSDQVLLYNVEPWSLLGFGVPNFGVVLQTLNQPIQGLADEIGRLQLYVMTHIDATRRQPPSANTVQRICKMMNRVFSVLGGRAKDFPELRIEPGHGTPAPIPWQLHPVPYFDSGIVRNGWMKSYNRLCMLALTNMMQHSDNNLALTITKEFASDILIYFNEIKVLIGKELLQIPPAELQQPDFVFTEAHYANYHPDQVTVREEGLDTPGDIASRFTEEDLRPLSQGIPSTLIITNLAKYPVGPVQTGYQGARGEPIEPSTPAPGTVGGTAIQPII